MKKISLVTVIVFFIDRVSKILVSKFLKLNVRNKIIKNFFYLTYCHNDGAAFSIMSGNILFLIFITLIILYIIYKNIIKSKNIKTIEYISYGLLLGGILGNLFDRIFYGYVIDFLDFMIFKFNFAIFNIADISIVISSVLLIVFEGSDSIERRKINS